MKLLYLALLLLGSISLSAQDTLQGFMRLPKNTLAVAPFNDAVFGTANSLYYKRMISQRADNCAYLRIGTGFINRFELENVGSGNSDFTLRGGNVNFGMELLKRLGNFSVSIGGEAALSWYRGEGVLQAPLPEVLFYPGSVETTLRNRPRDESELNVGAFVAFTALRYHITRHFQIGLESGFGIGTYSGENRRSGASPGNDVLLQYKGSLRGFAPGRAIFLECNF